MTSLALPPSFDSTSAAGPMFQRHVRKLVLIGCMLAGPGTSSARRKDEWESLRRPETTTAGNAVVSPQPAGAAIGELRRLSGLTWDQLSRVFSVSRRSLHFWASGKPMAPSNEEHLQRVLAVVRHIDRGSASANRTALLGVSEGGSIPLDLLVGGEYERVLSLLGRGEAQRVASPKLSAEARAARTPQPTDELVGALHDRVHPASGRLLATKPIKPRGK